MKKLRIKKLVDDPNELAPTCPSCGEQDPDNFRYEQAVWTGRQVTGVNAAGKLVVDGLAEAYWDSEVGFAHLHCDSCGEDLKFPEDQIEWV